MDQVKQHRCVVVIPVYRVPTPMEQCSFVQCLRVLRNYAITIVTHEGVDLERFEEISKAEQKELGVEYFDKHYFAGISGYNALCLSKDFYGRFTDRFEYMLIYQLDAWVFKDELQQWCDREYDYVGSPFFISPDDFKTFTKNLGGVGNGGLSLRRLQYCIDVLSCPISKPFLSSQKIWKIWMTSMKYSKEPLLSKLKYTVRCILMNFGRKNTLGYFIKYNNEDYILSDFASGSNFLKPHIPTAEEAISFSFEIYPSLLFQWNHQRLPFGCHAFEKYEFENFWSKYIPGDIQLPTE